MVPTRVDTAHVAKNKGWGLGWTQARGLTQVQRQLVDSKGRLEGSRVGQLKQRQGRIVEQGVGAAGWPGLSVAHGVERR